MRKYRVYYWAEINDECEYIDIEIEAKDIFIALISVQQSIKVYKRIYKIEEV